MCVSVLLACMSVPYTRDCPTESRRETWISRNWHWSKCHYWRFVSWYVDAEEGQPLLLTTEQSPQLPELIYFYNRYTFVCVQECIWECMCMCKNPFGMSVSPSTINRICGRKQKKCCLSRTRMNVKRTAHPQRIWLCFPFWGEISSRKPETGIL